MHCCKGKYSNYANKKSTIQRKKNNRYENSYKNVEKKKSFSKYLKYFKSKINLNLLVT